MQTAQQRADELENAARLDAAAKLKVFHDAVRRLWGEANSIPGGCGGTPFRTEARKAERKLATCVTEFRSRFGDDAVKSLGLIYGVDGRR